MGVLKLFFTAIIVHVSAHPEANRHTNVGIIGGHQVRIEEVPFMASLRLNGTHYCGASIISNQFILTAAHCIEPNTVVTVQVGTDRIHGDGELFEVEEIYLHESYNSKTYEYDVCLIKLKNSMTFGPKVRNIKLAGRHFKVRKWALLTIAGWGRTDTTAVSPTLLQVQIPLVSKRHCETDYAPFNFTITSRMICAGKAEHDSCWGDSGGPLTIGNTQVGIASFGLGCGVIPGVYWKVSSVLPWIINKMHLYY